MCVNRLRYILGIVRTTSSGRVNFYLYHMCKIRGAYVIRKLNSFVTSRRILRPLHKSLNYLANNFHLHLSIVNLYYTWFPIFNYTQLFCPVIYPRGSLKFVAVSTRNYNFHNLTSARVFFRIVFHREYS